MNVLEKILEELENESQLAHEEMRRCARGNPLQFDEVKGYARAMEYVVDTIRSHMDEVSGMRGKRLIDANALDEEVRNFRFTITGDPSQSTVVRECKESFRRMIDEQPTVYEANDWIPVEEGMPEEDDGKKYTITDVSGCVWSEMRYGHPYIKDEAACFYRPYDDWDCYTPIAIAWQPLPEPYKGGRE